MELGLVNGDRLLIADFASKNAIAFAQDQVRKFAT